MGSGASHRDAQYLQRARVHGPPHLVGIHQEKRLNDRRACGIQEAVSSVVKLPCMCSSKEAGKFIHNCVIS